MRRVTKIEHVVLHVKASNGPKPASCSAFPAVVMPLGRQCRLRGLKICFGGKEQCNTWQFDCHWSIFFKFRLRLRLIVVVAVLSVARVKVNRRSLILTTEVTSESAEELEQLLSFASSLTVL